MGRLRMRLFLSIIFIGECFAQWVDNPSCNFYGPNGYTLSWSADPSGIIYFNYTQNNFPTNGNYWTGVTFGTASGHTFLIPLGEAPDIGSHTLKVANKSGTERVIQTKTRAEIFESQSSAQ
uniref:Fibronectin type-III domain-containing protein n=1 Tax=Ascaris lumbricoides TaxID=6252 RepID=A0A0M3HPZ9_ASCLU